MELDYIALTLFLLYLLLLFLALHQLVSVIWSKNKVWTYRNGILFILFVSFILRVFIFAKTMSPSIMPDTLLMVIYFLPVWCNFAAISLLCVFYANAMLFGYYQDLPWKICLIFNTIFLILNITIASLLESSNVSENQGKIFYDVYVIYAIFLDILTACIIGYFGTQFIYNNQSRKNWLLPRSHRIFAVVNWLIVICFLIRSLFVGLLSTSVIIQHSDTVLVFSGEHKPTSSIILGFYIITEWLPNSALLYLLWRSSGNFNCTHFASKFSGKSSSTKTLSRRSFRHDQNGLEADFSDDFSEQFDDYYEVFLTQNPDGIQPENSLYRPIAASVDEDETIKVIYGSQQNSLASYDPGVDFLLSNNNRHNDITMSAHLEQEQIWLGGWFGWGKGVGEDGGVVGYNNDRAHSWSGNQRM